jgi:hypothetical protein
MKTIQNITHRRFAERTIKAGDQIIFLTGILIAFVIMCLPWILIIERF